MGEEEGDELAAAQAALAAADYGAVLAHPAVAAWTPAGARAAVWWTDVAPPPAAGPPAARRARLLAAAASLAAFVQENAAGPPVAWPPAVAVWAAPPRPPEGWAAALAAALEVSGERPAAHTRALPLLLLAARLLRPPPPPRPDPAPADPPEDADAWRRWRLRLAAAVARSLAGPAADALAAVERAAADVRAFVEPRAAPRARAASALERAAAYLACAHSAHGAGGLLAAANSARAALDDARAALGFDFELAGALGRRTRYQTFDVALLVVQTSSRPSAGPAELRAADCDAEPPRAMPALPVSVANPDDLLLDAPALAAPAADAALGPLEQLLLLMTAELEHMQGPVDALGSEQAMALVSRALAAAGVHSGPPAPSELLPLAAAGDWLVRSYGLLLRSRLEADNPRVADRALMQLRALADQFADPDVPAVERMSLAFAVPYPLIADLQRDLGFVYQRLGAFVSALEYFERLGMVYEAVQCLVALRRGPRAEELAREELDRAPTPEMWCLLGDVTRNPVAYHRAWELSGERFARAQRSLGFYYVERAAWPEAVKAFERALHVNPVHAPAWFALGSSAMRVGDWSRARAAYSRVTQLEPDSYEAWANLANCCLKLGDKTAAFFSLERAVRVNFDSQKLWYNLLVVAMDVGAFSQAITAQRRLVELGSGEPDAEVLGILVRVVLEDIVDRDGRHGSSLRETLVALFKFLEARVSLPPPVYELFSRLLAADAAASGEPAAFSVEAVEATNKEVRALMSSPGWRTEAAEFAALAAVLRRYHVAVAADPDVERRTRSLHSAALRVRSVLKQSEEALDGSAERVALAAVLE